MYLLIYNVTVSVLQRAAMMLAYLYRVVSHYASRIIRKVVLMQTSMFAFGNIAPQLSLNADTNIQLIVCACHYSYMYLRYRFIVYHFVFIVSHMSTLSS